MPLTAVFRKVPKGYIAFVEELAGANAQGATVDKARENFVEPVELVLGATRALAEDLVRGKTVVRESLSAA